MKTKLLYVLLVLGFANSFISITWAQQAPAGEFRMAVNTFDEEILDPVGGTNNCKWYQTLIFDSLVGIVPPSTEVSTKTGIAYRWEHSSDYKKWTFYLRKGIKFHNGDEVTAEDIKYSIDRAVGPASLSTNKVVLQGSIDKVEVADDYKIVIHCKNPDSMLPLSMSEQIGPDAMIVPKKYIEKNGNDYFKVHPVGTGPYKLKEHVPGTYFLLEAVDKHWALGVPKYKYVRLLLVPESLARIGLLRRGEVDMITVPLERVKEVEGMGFPIVADPGAGINLFVTHETWDKTYPISDIRVREALNIAIDRETLHKTMFAGLGKIAMEAFAVEGAIGYEPLDMAPYPYNPERAKALLKEAGYGPGNPCKIPCYSYSESLFPHAEKVIEVLAAQYWGKVGFDIEIIKVPDYGVLRKKWAERTTKGAISPSTAGGRVWAIPITRALCHKDGRLSISRIPELDTAIDKALSAIDPKERARLAHEVFREVYNQYLNIPLVEIVLPFGVNPKTIPDWKNWSMGPTVYDFNLEWVLSRR